MSLSANMILRKGIYMEKREFKAESKRLLDLMINSIYTHKEIFLRELISNSSDAIDKIYYKALTDDSILFNKEDYYIKIEIDEDKRLVKVIDTGIGMTKEELEENLGIIAKSGSHAFKENNEIKDGFDIIGQFGVGFYSAFMVADKVTVLSKALGADKGYKWESEGADGFTIEEWAKDSVGTEITLKIKENTEDETYDDFLHEYRIRNIIKKYSNFIRYPIKMDISKSRLKEGTEDQYEDYVEEETVNTMIPIWRKNKSELRDEDYENFYSEKHTPSDDFGHLLFYGWDSYQWNMFDYLMMYSVQEYLDKGVASSVCINDKYNKLLAETGKQFTDWITTFDLNYKFKYEKSVLYKDYVNHCEGCPDVNRLMFCKRLQVYAKIYGIKTTESHSGYERYIEFAVV